ncbi:MAG: T9SS type A sorting domain-containing protein [Candidatus Kapabacteria bacterium]|nr:T9SS type A sorting domain-containing protein [Candidatus Kapabacteria bacterium]
MRKLILISFILLNLNLYSQNGWREIFTARWFISSDCADSNNCMGLSYSGFSPRLYFTSDAGLTWSQIFTDSIIYDDPEERTGIKVARCISYSKSKIALIGCDSGHILRTTDNGLTWTKSNVGKRVTISKIIMKDEREGIAFDNLYLHKTNDGGLSWFELPFPVQTYNRQFEDFAYIEGRIFIYFAHRYDNNIHLWYSDDDGKNWTETKYLTRNGGWLYAVNKNKIWVLNRKLDIKTNKWFDYVINSSDAGETWQVQLDTICEPSNFTLTFIRFYDSNNGIICGYNGEIHRTTNGGLNWFQDRCSFNDSELIISSASYLTEDKILIFTENGKVYKFDKSTLNVNSIISNSGINIFPNPAKDYIEIFYNIETGLSPASNDEINIYNILGECVLSEKIHPITLSYRMNIEHLPSGLYYVRLGDWVGRFVKIE